MKRLYLLLLVSLTNLTMIAQNPGFQYFGTMWYLKKIEENNVTFTVPPYNGFADWRFQIAHTFIGGVQTDDHVTGEYCVGFTGPVNVGDDHFNFINSQFAVTLNMCDWTTNDDVTMMNRHINFYQNYLPHLFYFEIQSIGTENWLIITNNAGNKAYYSTVPLANIKENELEQFIKVYPNPFEDHFFVEDNDQVIEEIKIFDNTGRLIKTVLNPNIAQEIYTGFSSSIYHINIKAKDGRIMNKKMIKK